MYVAVSAKAQLVVSVLFQVVIIIMVMSYIYFYAVSKTVAQGLSQPTQNKVNGTHGKRKKLKNED